MMGACVCMQASFFSCCVVERGGDGVVTSKAPKASSLLLAAVMVVDVFKAGHLGRGGFIGQRGRWVGEGRCKDPRRGA